MNVNKTSSSSSSILGRTEPRTTFRSFHEDFPDTENPLSSPQTKMTIVVL